jgi:protein YibB
MSLCLVTAFFDIGRDTWSSYPRSLANYFYSFEPYLDMRQEMIVYIDDRYLTIFTELCHSNQYIKIIGINGEWLSQHIHAYNQLEREREIIHSDSFKQLIANRLSCEPQFIPPECTIPEYNMLQHSKIDFVCHAILNNLSSAPYFAWTDFGYFKLSNFIPNDSLDLTKFNLDKINFQTINPVQEEDKQILYVLKLAPERIGGFFYLGSRELLLSYQTLYHDVYTEFQSMNIADDDQHLMLQCYFRQPELFHLWDLGGWHRIYTHFQRDS